MFVIISNTAYESCNEFHAVFATYAEAVEFFKTPECTEGDMCFGEEIVIAARRLTLSDLRKTTE